jgi:cobalt/nickel transport system ATP-binding protein
MSDPLLEFDNVDFSYGPERPVLGGCSLALAAGDRVALSGANGSGKTTLMHLAVGLLRPTGGSIRAFGRPRASEADFYEVRCRVGLLFQDADDQLFCPTVAEDVAFGPFNLGKSRSEVERIVAATLASVGLTGYQHRVTHKLSGGEKRLVALASVLAMQPDVLLLDEPVGGLDEDATARLVDLLLRLPQAMLIVAHDQEFLRQTTRLAWRLEHGRVESIAPHPV